MTDPTKEVEFVVSRIVEEARNKGVALSEAERKMLYFSETVPSLPDVTEINEDFHMNYDAEEYEHKIAQLIRSARKRDQDVWSAAIRITRDEDRYLNVMLDQAG